MFVRCLTVHRVSTAVAIAIAAGTCRAARAFAGRPAADDLPRHAARCGTPARRRRAPTAAGCSTRCRRRTGRKRRARPTSTSCRWQQGVSSTRQLTFTKEKNETSPRWARDGRGFFFLSNREAPENAASRNQLYLMRPDGGEARRITDAREGVRDFALSQDGKWLVYRTGKDGEEQLYRLPIAGIETATAEQLTKQPTGVGNWQLGARRQAHLLRHARTRSTRTRRRAARRSSPSTSATRRRRRPACGRWISIRARPRS